MVRQVSAAGIITRVAGTGTSGNSGDNELATDAEFASPMVLEVTSDGGFLIADTGNDVVRKVSPGTTPAAWGVDIPTPHERGRQPAPVLPREDGAGGRWDIPAPSSQVGAYSAAAVWHVELNG